MCDLSDRCRIDLVDLSRECPARDGVSSDLHLVALLDLGVVGLGDADQNLHRSDLLDDEDSLAGVEVTLVVVPRGDYTADRGTEQGVLKQVVVGSAADLPRHLGGVEIRL